MEASDLEGNLLDDDDNFEEFKTNRDSFMQKIDTLAIEKSDGYDEEPGIVLN